MIQVHYFRCLCDNNVWPQVQQQHSQSRVLLGYGACVSWHLHYVYDVIVTSAFSQPVWCHSNIWVHVRVREMSPERYHWTIYQARHDTLILIPRCDFVISPVMIVIKFWKKTTGKHDCVWTAAPNKVSRYYLISKFLSTQVYKNSWPTCAQQAIPRAQWSRQLGGAGQRSVTPEGSRDVTSQAPRRCGTEAADPVCLLSPPNG